jgi:hypothetical protein
MNTIPLTSVSNLLFTHMVAVANPKDEDALVSAYLVAAHLWGDKYIEKLLSFGRQNAQERLDDDIMMCCIMILAGAKAGVESWQLLLVVTELVDLIHRDTGLSVQAFCDLMDNPDLPTLRERLEAFLVAVNTPQGMVH